MNAEAGPVFPEAGDRPVTFNDLNDALNVTAGKAEAAGMTPVAAGLSLLTAELIVTASRRHFDATTAVAPVVKVGDRILVGDKWHTVIGHILRGWPCVKDQLGTAIDPATITDVYTAEEHARNSALVQFESHLDRRLRFPNIDWDTTHLAPGDLAFITPEATAALGSFRPVPDRPIVAGDCVRWGNDNEAVFVVGEIETGDFAYDANGGFGVRLDSLSLVAREDAAYIAPVIKDEPHTNYNTGQACDCMTEAEREVKDEPGIGSLLKHFGLDQNRYVTEDGRVIYEPAQPNTDDRPHDEGIVRRGGKGDGSSDLDLPNGGVRPEWLDWPLITAGDGRVYRGTGRHPKLGFRFWQRLDRPDLESLTTAEIAALGPVREAVIVTLPDLPWENAQDEDGTVHAGFPGGWMRPGTARKVAAELLAAARAAEKTGGAE